MFENSFKIYQEFYVTDNLHVTQYVWQTVHYLITKHQDYLQHIICHIFFTLLITNNGFQTVKQCPSHSICQGGPTQWSVTYCRLNTVHPLHWSTEQYIWCIYAKSLLLNYCLSWSWSACHSSEVIHKVHKHLQAILHCLISSILKWRDFSSLKDLPPNLLHLWYTLGIQYIHYHRHHLAPRMLTVPKVMGKNKVQIRSSATNGGSCGYKVDCWKFCCHFSADTYKEILSV